MRVEVDTGLFFPIACFALGSTKASGGTREDGDYG